MANTGNDDLFEDAKRVVVLHQSGSTSLLQRRLRIGYTRAARLIETMQEKEIIGQPQPGTQGLEVLDYGKPGYLCFVTPYITSVPAVSVMMGDLGVMHPAEECGCGIKSPWFEIAGRAGISKNKSCAVSAAELLKKESE